MRVFAEAEREIVGGEGALKTLANNYRSSGAVVSFVNEFFEKLFSVDFFESGEPRLQTAVCGQRPDGAPSDEPGRKVRVDTIEFRLARRHVHARFSGRLVANHDR